MTHATHTPSPWAWQDGRLIGDLDGDGGDVSFAAIGNARLIAAAPDLLAALTKLVANWDANHIPSPLDDLSPPNLSIEAARAAINKAKGN